MSYTMLQENSLYFYRCIRSDKVYISEVIIFRVIDLFKDLDVANNIWLISYGLFKLIKCFLSIGYIFKGREYSCDSVSHEFIF